MDALGVASCLRETAQLYDAMREANLVVICHILKIGFTPFACMAALEYYRKLVKFVLRLMLEKVALRFLHPPVTMLMAKEFHAEALWKANQTTMQLYALSPSALDWHMAYALAK